VDTSVKHVRGALPAASRDRSTRRGLTYFVVAAVLYGSTFAAIGLASSWAVRLLSLAANGLSIGVLFIVGHDACHGSLTPKSTLNRWLARIALLPSLHPMAAWEYSHNALHHGWTNLRGKDPVYCPRTLADFRTLSPARQRIERLYRSWIGLLPLYLASIWWPLEMRPSAEHRRHIDKRGTFVFDRGCVLAFPALQALVLVLTLRIHADVLAWERVAVIALGVCVPFLLFTWLIGFATFQHHTHPRVLWYADESEWSYFRSQVQGTVHVEFPRWVELMLNNIMEHTAHHVDTRVPLYNLTDAQDALEEAFGEENVITERFSLRGMTETFRTCQLYDYERHQWLSFDGSPTTEARCLDDEAASAPTPTSSLTSIDSLQDHPYGGVLHGVDSP